MYSYNRTAALDPTEELDHAESTLLEVVAMSSDKEADALLKQAVDFIQKAKARLGQQAVTLQPMLDAVKHVLDASGREVGGFGKLQPAGFELGYHVRDFPRYPPDDDGPGDAAYYRRVQSEVQKATKLIQQALSAFPQKSRVQVELREKGFFTVEVSVAR